MMFESEGVTKRRCSPCWFQRVLSYLDRFLRSSPDPGQQHRWNLATKTISWSNEHVSRSLPRLSVCYLAPKWPPENKNKPAVFLMYFSDLVEQFWCGFKKFGGFLVFVEQFWWDFNQPWAVKVFWFRYLDHNKPLKTAVTGFSRLAASLPSASHFYFNYVILGWLVLPMAIWRRTSFWVDKAALFPLLQGSFKRGWLDFRGKQILWGSSLSLYPSRDVSPRGQNPKNKKGLFQEQTRNFSRPSCFYRQSFGQLSFSPQKGGMKPLRTCFAWQTWSPGTVRFRGVGFVLLRLDFGSRNYQPIGGFRGLLWNIILYCTI